ncbi:hypothetical protein CKA38_14820 [Ereboglobus luteus]|uniref:Uncharacterized protein n=2 Tax=Ereboglobus luteus TaxID=1796921 RepID=A0A2U8E604_9BACT|nr:hypothetical protein CKA38_14820 [Ereboglobus luteus]
MAASSFAQFYYGVPEPGIVELPELEVIGSRYEWKYVKTGNFELYSNLDDIDFITRFATLLETSHNLIKSQFKGFLTNRTLQKKYVLCYESTRQDRFSVMERNTREHKRADQGVRVFTYEKRNGRLYNYRTNRLSTALTLADLHGDIMPDDVKHTLGGRANARSRGRVNDWFRTAICYMRLNLNEKSAVDRGEYLVVFNSEIATQADAAAKKPSVSKMIDGFSNTIHWHSQNRGRRTNEDLRNDLRCFNFVYYCMFGNQGRHRAAMAAFMAWLNKHDASEEVFINIFGIDYKTMEKEISEYFAKIYKTNRCILPIANTAEKPERIDVQRVVRSRSSRLLSDAFYVANDDFRARALLLKALDEQPNVLNDPEFKASLALNELYADEGDREKAADWLEELVQMKIPRPRVYAEVANLRLKKTLPSNQHDATDAFVQRIRASSATTTDPFHAFGWQIGEAANWLRLYQRRSEQFSAYRLSMEEVAHSMEPLVTAFSMYQSESLYVMLTTIWFLSDHAPPKNIMNKIKEGCMLYPTNTVMIECTLDILKRHDAMAGAEELLKHGFIHALRSNEAKVVNMVAKFYDLNDPIAERTKDGLKREQWQRFYEVMQSAKTRTKTP